MKKVVLVTGVSSGLGKSIVLKLLTNSDYTVVGLGRNMPQEINEKIRFEFITMDLNDENSIEKAISTVEDRYKQVDVLINNSGFAYKGTICEINMSEVKEQFQVNVFGTMYLTQLVLKLMRVNKSGHIINISSLGATINTPTLGYYAATKAALDKLSRILSLEVKEFNINVSTIAPGTIKTKFGKNIRDTKNIHNLGDQAIYQEWDKRFRNFFKNYQTADELADIVISVIEKPRDYVFTNLRDKLIFLSSRLPFKLHNFILTKLFLRT